MSSRDCVMEDDPTAATAEALQVVLAKLGDDDSYGKLMSDWLDSIDQRSVEQRLHKPPKLNTRRLSTELRAMRAEAQTAALQLWGLLHGEWLVANDERKAKTQAQDKVIEGEPCTRDDATGQWISARDGSVRKPRPSGTVPTDDAGNRCTWDAVNGSWCNSDGSHRASKKRGPKDRAGKAAEKDLRDSRLRQHMSARSPRDRLAKQARSVKKAPLQVDEHGNCNCPAHGFCQHCPPSKLEEEADALANKLHTRIHASTNTIMQLDHEDERLQELLTGCVSVTEETKQQLLQEWASGPMAHTKKLHSCAACGLRDPTVDYHTDIPVGDLPEDVFCLCPEQVAQRAGLGSIPMAFKRKGKEGVDWKDVDLTRLVSCYEAADGALFHLHPELVDSTGAEPCVTFCDACFQAGLKGKASDFSLAAGVDYSWLARVPELKPLTEPERMVLSEQRLYHIVMKVRETADRPTCSPASYKYFPADQFSQPFKKRRRR